MKLRILVLTRHTKLISARVFERAFFEALRPIAEVRRIQADMFLDSIFGRIGDPRSWRQAAVNFLHCTKDADFLCPDYITLGLLPRIVSLRNQSNSPCRLFMIAHSPALYLLEWALLQHLLRPGDRVIVPSKSAASVIAFLCPPITPYVRHIPHSVLSLGPPEPSGRRCVYMGRVTERKLLHRLVEAIARLRSRGQILELDVAGNLFNPWTGEPLPYAGTLRAQVCRLGLAGQVRLIGPVEGDEAKRSLLKGAVALVNPSVTLEESFGQSVAEALTAGIPAMVTRWDGLPELAETTGSVVPVIDTPLTVDVSAEAMASAIEELIARPSRAEACVDSARRFHPGRVGFEYKRAMEEAVEERRGPVADQPPDPSDNVAATPKSGLLSHAAPLTAYSWTELFRAHVRDFDQMRKEAPGARTKLSESGHLRAILGQGCRRTLERFAAGITTPEGVVEPNGIVGPPLRGNDFLERLVSAGRSGAAYDSRVACLAELCRSRHTPAARALFDQIRGEGIQSPEVRFLEVEILIQEGQHEVAFERSLSEIDAVGWGAESRQRLLQLSRATCAGGFAARGLPLLRDWTARYPDAPGALEVWLDRAQCAAAAGFIQEAQTCLAASQALVGSSALFRRVAARLNVDSPLN